MVSQKKATFTRSRVMSCGTGTYFASEGVEEGPCATPALAA